MNREEALALGRPLGGKAVAKKRPPDVCPMCGMDMTGRSWHSYLGHLGLHGLADRYFGGDLEAAQRRLRENGLAKQRPEPMSRDGGLPAYEPVGG